MAIVLSLENSIEDAKKFAKRMKFSFSQTKVSAFPDGDLYLKINVDVKGKEVYIYEGMQPNPNKILLDIIFLAKQLKDLKAKKIVLLCPYLAFMRQDKMFNKYEVVNAQVMGDLVNKYLDGIITIDPHLHRILKMKDLFKINPAKNLTSNHLIADHIKKNFKNFIIMGPDWESYQWAEEISKETNSKNTIMEKTRFSGRKIKNEIKKEIDMKGKNVIIVDDIISTGKTMIGALKESKKRGAKSVNAIGVHGLFIEKGYEKMKKAGFSKIITCNTVKHKTNKIDIISLFCDELKRKNKK